MHNLVNSLCFIYYLFVLNESMSLDEFGMFAVFGCVGLCFDESFLHSEPRDRGEGEQKGL